MEKEKIGEWLSHLIIFDRWFLFINAMLIGMITGLSGKYIIAIIGVPIILLLVILKNMEFISKHMNKIHKPNGR